MLIFILLLILLSLESSFLLPLFSSYLFWQRAQRFSVWQALLSLFIASVFLSSFYYLPLPITTSFLFLFYFLVKDRKNVWLSVIFFLLFNLYIFFVGKLAFNIFYLIQIPAFIFLIYRKEFKNYGGKKTQ